MATAALILVTAVWGVTFVQVKDAIELYPLIAFLAVRYVIASVALAPPALRRVSTLGRDGLVAGGVLGVLIALGIGLQTAGLERTTVTNTGFITGLYVVFTPLLALALFRTPIPRELWAAVGLALVGLALLSGVPEGSGAGDLLVLSSTVAQALQIVMVERYANRYDVFALTFVQVAVAAVAFLAIAVALGDLRCRAAPPSGPRCSSRASLPSRSRFSSRSGRSGASARRASRSSSPSRPSSRGSSATCSPETG